MWPLADVETRLWASIQVTVAGTVLDHREDHRDEGSVSDVAAAEEHALHLISVGLRPPGYSGEMTTAALVERGGRVTG